MLLRAFARDPSRVAVGLFLLGAGCTFSGCGLVLDLPEATLDPTVDAGHGTSSGSTSSGGTSSGGASSGDGGSCTDVTTAQDCGRCGHDCERGACVAGVCQAAPVETGQGAPKSTAIAGNQLFWTNWSSGELNVRGRGFDLAPSRSVEKIEQPSTVRVDDTSVYFAGVGGVHSCPLTGCPESGSQVLLSTDGYPRSFAASPSQLFVICDGDPGALVRVEKSGFASTSMDQSRFGASHLAVGPASIYLSDGTGVYEYAPTATASDEAPLVVTNGSLGGAAVGSDPNRLFYGVAGQDGAGDHIEMRNLGNAAPATYASDGSPFPDDIVSDSSFVYWANRGHEGAADGSVLACPVSGCTSPLVIAKGLGAPKGLSFDDHYLYFVSTDGGSVYAAVKPTL